MLTRPVAVLLAALTCSATATADKAKPYAVVKVTLAEPVKDSAFDTLRQQVADAAKKKDRDALAKLAVDSNFFWIRENGDTADKTKPGIEPLTAVFDLSNKDTNGWDALTAYATDFVAAPSPDQKGAWCGPADPKFIDDELRDAIEKTQSDVADWAYTLRPDVEVRASADAASAVIEKLGLHFVRVIEAPDRPKVAVAEIATPSGKTGFVPANAIAPLGNDQLCFAKDTAGNWKIAGYIGSGEAK